MANISIWNIEFSAARNTFYCECGAPMQWDGGRFAVPGHEHEMEVIRCSECGHAVDPALVIDRAINALRVWNARRDAYYARAAQRAAEAAAREAQSMSFLDRVCNLWRSL
jgi:hypothetical protein